MGFLIQRTTARKRPTPVKRTRMRMGKETGVVFFKNP